MDDWIADFRSATLLELAATSPTAQAVVAGVIDHSPPLPPPLIEAYWPGWLCWLMGHEPIVHGSPARDDLRCLCGAEVASRARVLALRGTTLWHPWQRFVARLWRVLP